LKDAHDVLKEIAVRFKARRLSMDLTQEELAVRAGVSLGSLKRFERTGLIALETLLRIAVALRCLDDFDALAAKPQLLTAGKTLDQILAAEPRQRRRASGGRGK
jgi:transcriptional regulator with XRE-family HTH domain